VTQAPPKTVLAVDPGSSKCGVAVVRREPAGTFQILWRSVVPGPDLAAALESAREAHGFDLVVVGSGTRSRPTVEAVRGLWPGVAVLVVDERDTSLRARERYWIHNPRRGWRRLLPATLQTPPEPIDDFAAVVLAERVLSG
jgi:RNase H-fold protein (predicted Holliday junction resolvase)